MPDHQPTPWAVDKPHSGSRLLSDADGRAVAIVAFEGTSEYKRDMANLNFVAACVNAVGACVGSPLRMDAIKAISEMSEEDFASLVWIPLVLADKVQPLDLPYAGPT